MNEITRIELSEDLKRVFEAPSHIYVKGSAEALQLLARLPRDGLAVVGTRRPQPRTEAFAREVILDLADSPLIIVSGLALGIDTVAHETALQAKLPTIAILGSGLNRIYPKQNTKLAERIVDTGGLLISEFDPDQEARPMHFLRRNRLIAAWTKATWVVEAAHRSGALNTAKHARDHHRDTFATPAFPGDPALAGNQGLLDDHQAFPLWNARSLGSSWIELATWASRDRPRTLKNASEENKVLASAVKMLTAQQGCAQMQELLDWAIARNWAPERFFGNLQACMEKGLIREQSGILIPGA